MSDSVQGDQVVPIKDGETERPIPSAWRETFRHIVDAFVAGDYGLARGVSGVEPVSAETALQVRNYIDDHGAMLAPLPEASWNSSVCTWYGDHWSALVDLWTEEEGRSDLVLMARVTEGPDGYDIQVDLVYVP